jgi:glycosyltransferase involved in cell wall biosynthesis
MHIAVFNAHIGLAGGGELVALNMVKALEEAGHKVDLVTYRFEVEDVERGFKLLTPGYKPSRLVVYETPRFIKLLGAGGRFVRLRKLLLVNDFLEKNRSKYDLIIDTSSNMPTKVDVVYVHYPTILRTSNRSGLHWRLYDKLVQYTSNRLLGKPKLVLCNSSWTAEKFKSAYNDDFIVEVLYPPVDVEYFSKVAGNIKENIVVTVSRFTPEKNMEKIVDVADKLRDFRFLVIGGRARYSESVIDKINKRIRELGVSNVELLFNVPRDKLREILGSAKYYLHPPYAEHFGISVVEAMSAGCIPIVYRDGGTWYDIVGEIGDILGYYNIHEAPYIIRVIEEDKKLYEKLRERSLEVSGRFTYGRFKRSLLNHLESILYIDRVSRLTETLSREAFKGWF